MTLLILALISGCLLGLRFKVAVLIPATIIAVLASVGISLASNTQPYWMLVAIVTAVTGLQLGYLGGVAISLFPSLLNSKATTTGRTGTATGAVVDHPISTFDQT